MQNNQNEIPRATTSTLRRSQSYRDLPSLDVDNSFGLRRSASSSNLSFEDLVDIPEIPLRDEYLMDVFETMHMPVDMQGVDIQREYYNVSSGVYDDSIKMLKSGQFRVPSVSAQQAFEHFMISLEFEDIPPQFEFNFKLFIIRLLYLRSPALKEYTNFESYHVRFFVADFLYYIYPYITFIDTEDRVEFRKFVRVLETCSNISEEMIPFILVGIETNPGPSNWQNQLEFMRGNDRIILQHSTTFLKFCAGKDLKSVGALLMSSRMYLSAVSNHLKIDRSSIILLSFIYCCSNPFEDAFQRCDNGFLVGIETNPGPSVLSTTNSLSGGVEAQMKFPISLGFDPTTNDTMEELITKVDQLLTNGVQFNHNVNPNFLANAIDPLVTKLSHQDITSKAYKITFTILVSILSVYLSFKVGSKLAKMVMSGICSVKKMSESIPLAESFCEAQIGSTDVVTGLLSYLYFQVANKSISNKDLSQFMSGCEKLGKQKEGLVSFVDFLLTVLQKFSTYMTRNFNLPAFTFKSTGDSNIDDIQEDLNALLEKLRTSGLYNAENGKLAFDLESRLRKIKAGMPRTRDFAAQHRSIYDLELALKPVIQRFERNNIVGNGPRSEPLGIMLGGSSGVGKSTATVPILLALMARVLPKEKLKSFMENHNDFIWNFVPENHFHDAFHGQFCTIIDEAGFCIDSVGVPDPGAMGAIRFINTACFPLTMAHLEDKGNTNFNSEVVFATTNRNFFKWDSMYSSEAYVRRFKIAMLAVPKEKYCVESTITTDPWARRLDLTKIPKGQGVFCEDVPEYIPWNFLTGTRAAGEILDFNQLVNKLVEDYNFTKQKGDALLGAHLDLKQRFAKDRFEAEMGEEDMFEEFANFDFPNVSFSNPVSILSMCVALASGVWYFLRESINDQSGDVKSKRVVKTSLKKSFKARPLAHKNFTAQYGVNSNVISGARKVLKRSVYKVFCETMKDSSVYATFVKGRVAIFPAHFFHAIQSFIDDGTCPENPTIVFERCSSTSIGFEVKFLDLDVVDMREEKDLENDIYFCVVPKVVPSHPDITSVFKPENNDTTRSRFEAMLAKPDGKDLVFMCTQAYAAGAVTYGAFDVGQSFKYELPTRKGDCGSLLFSTGPSAGKGVIVGMHVAGNEKNMGISTKIDYQMILAAALLCDAPTTYVSDKDDFEIQIGDNFTVGEEVKILPLPTVNSVIRSPLYGKYNEPKCAPTMLREMDLGEGLRDPWKNARSKYSKFQKCVDLDHLDVVACNVSQMILFAKKYDDPWEARLFSFEEAVSGIPGVSFVEGIPRNTSSGYPFCLDVKLKGKKDWFGEVGDYSFSSVKCDELRDSVNNSISELERGFRMDVKYADYLKDERRSVEKVKLGKTRLISASPLDYLIICRMYFGDFVRSVMSGRISNEMAIGVNPYSAEWTYLVSHLTSTGDKCIFGDYSAYDGSLPISFMYKALDIIEDFYSTVLHNPQDSVVRAALFEDIVNSKHIAVKDGKAFVYEWNGSNPSGNFLTTVLNSVCNLMLIRYAASKIVIEKGLYTGSLSALSDFSHNVKCIVFGDDNGMSVSDAWAPYLTQASFTHQMSLIGMTYTDESKSLTNDLVHRPITSCTFLKRAFKYDAVARRWDAPLEKDTIEEMCNWTKKNVDIRQFSSTVETALKEASLHGPEYYNEFASRIRLATLENLEYAPVVNYKSALVAARSEESRY